MNRYTLPLLSIILLFTTLYSNDAVKNQRQPKPNNPYIEEMVATITEAEAESMLRTLVDDFGTRNATHPGCVQACEWARDQFISWGLDSVYLDDFSSSYAPNVVAIKKGTKEVQDSIFITGGHIDCMPNASISPGADDNASGSVATLLAAKAMSTWEFRNDVRYILFNAEEYGLAGSKAYVRDHKNDNIKGVIINDMCLWYASGDSDWDIESQNSYRWLGNILEGAAEDYADMPTAVVTPSY